MVLIALVAALTLAQEPARPSFTEWLAGVRAARDAAAVAATLRALRADCERAEVNALPAIVAAVRAHATLGEICGAMREAFGEYKPV